MQQNDIELALQRGDVRQELGEVGAGTQRQNIVSALAGLRRRIDAYSALDASFLEALEKFGASIGFFGFVAKGEGLRSKPGFEMAAHGGPGKIVEVGGHAM